MSEPTTDKIREGYAERIGSMGFRFADPTKVIEFDRWLEQHNAEITAKAEARIIKLLEKIDKHRTHAESLQCGFCDAVALIKGKAE